MSKKTVRYRIDPRDLPPLTRAQKAELTALKAASDSDIDYSEIPEREILAERDQEPILSDQEAADASLDADVVAWFKRRTAADRQINGAAISKPARAAWR